MYVKISEILLVLVVGDRLTKDLLAEENLLAKENLLAEEISAIYVVPLVDVLLSIFHHCMCPPTPLCVRWWDHVV